MKIFGWSKELESGIQLIDTQHKQIIELANLIIIRRKFGDDTIIISEYLDFLQKYIQYHLQSEEAFQSNTNYPKHRAHQVSHQSLATEFKFILVKLQASNYEIKEAEKFYNFFISSIKNHILVDDLEFSVYYKNILNQPKCSSL
ncbi:MAG: hemerythrin domain-containing protein [Oscillospiraceae bacterium]